MFIISERGISGINPAFPFLPSPFKTIRASEIGRLQRIAPVFIGIEAVLLLGMLSCLLNDGQFPLDPAYLQGGLLATIVSRLLCRKIVSLRRANTTIAGLAPIAVWIDHVLLCVTFGCASLLGAKTGGLEIAGTSFFSLFAWLCFSVAALPLLNLIAYWRTTGAHR